MVFVNEYAIITSLGRGSFGEVKLALNTKDMEVYALKLIAKTRQSRPLPAKDSPHLAEASVLHEINVMKELSHPNLVRLIEVIGSVSFWDSHWRPVSALVTEVEGRPGLLQSLKQICRWVSRQIIFNCDGMI